MTHRDPRLLPGVSAWGYSILVAVIGGLGPLVVFAGLLVVADVMQQLILAVCLLVVLVSLGAVLCWRLWVASGDRAAREVAAGYTTMRGFPNLDRINARTGRVTRPAVAASRGLPAGSGSISVGDDIPSIDTERSPVSIALGGPVLLPATLVSIIVLGLAIWTFSTPLDTAWELLFSVFGSVVGFVAALLIPLIAFSARPMRYFEGALAAHLDQAQVWATYDQQNELWAIRRELVVGEDREPGHSSSVALIYLAFEPERLTFWRRKGRHLNAFLSVPRSRVADVSGGEDAGSLAATNSTTLELLANDGSTLPVSLMLRTRSVWASGVRSENADAAAAISRWLTHGA